MSQSEEPRILLISQWPGVKNAEYELIEKIRQTGFKITVVDYFGFDVETGDCLNTAVLTDHFDFAISFHYDTPKLLNLTTYLWVANPLAFMYLRGDYRSHIIHNLRAYDDYLYNGADKIKAHIQQVVGDDWVDTGLSFFASSAESSLLPVRIPTDIPVGNEAKIFYCGVNWERGIDEGGRARGLLDILQDRNAADFYGPRQLEGFSPWEGFSSYIGEIPFDGVSMSVTMREYGAVLAVSSPAHIQSQTSSSRVFEGFLAGVPVISDVNPHVKSLFGEDLVYYFEGDSEEERVSSIQSALLEISENPIEANRRVQEAQRLISETYCFDKTLGSIRNRTAEMHAQRLEQLDHDTEIEVFLFFHAPYELTDECDNLNNLGHISIAANFLGDEYKGGIKLKLLDISQVPELSANLHVEQIENVNLDDWSSYTLGEKVSQLSKVASGDLTVFLTQFDHVHHDFFEKLLEHASGDQEKLDLNGFFVSDFHKAAPKEVASVLISNSSTELYRWTQNSLAEHQLGQFVISRRLREMVDFNLFVRFDVLLPIAILLACIKINIPVNRRRNITLRVQRGAWDSHHDAYQQATLKGFWSQHYDLLSNYNHELNALVDSFHSSSEAVEIFDAISGFSLPPAPVIPVPIVPDLDPAIIRVNLFLLKIRPVYRFFRMLIQPFIRTKNA
jgi:hypothetical protein